MDIVERLREEGKQTLSKACLEAADEIERLRSLVELLIRRNTKLKKIYSEYVIKTTTAALKETE